MKALYRIAAVLALTGIALGATSSGSVGQTHTVVFNELMWMGSAQDPNDEWMELRNTTGGTVDLSGWKIKKADDTDMLVIPEGATIQPYGVFLIANFADTSSSSHLQAVPDLVTTAVSLSNSTLQVKLVDPSVADSLMDIAGDGGAPLAGSNGDPKAAMVRQYSETGFPGVDDGTLEDSWFTAVYRSGWDEGTTELGTPGSLEPAKVKMDLAEHTVVLRDTFEVGILIEDVIDLFALNINAYFDPTVVRYLSTEGGDFLGSLLDTTTIQGWQVGDSLNIGISRLGPIGGVMGSGTVAKLRFEAIGADSSRTGLDFDNVKLRNSNLRWIEAMAIPDSIMVVTLKVLATSPDSGAYNVINSSPIRALFDNHPVDLPTPAHFYLIPDTGPPLYGTTTYDAFYKVVRLDPEAILADDMVYTALLDSSLGMQENYTWGFTASIAGDIFDLGDPTDTDPFDHYIADGLVDGDDLGVLGYFYYSTTDSSYWSPVADLNKDNKVDGSDLAILGLHYGQTSSHYEGSPLPKRAQFSDGDLAFLLLYPQRQLQEGEMFQAQVHGEHMADLYAWTVYIPFDPAHLEVEEVRAIGPMMDRAALLHRAEKGVLNIGGTRLGHVAGLHGDAPLAQITFKTKQHGTPHLTIGGATARDPHLHPIPVAVHPVRVVETHRNGRPKDFALARNVPNPFNSATAIRYALPVEADVRLVIYNLNGQHVRTLVEGRRSAGLHTIRWDSTDDQHLPAASGIYIYQLEIREPRRLLSQKMLLLR